MGNDPLGIPPALWWLVGLLLLGRLLDSPPAAPEGQAEVVALLREDLRGELDAIQQYGDHLLRIADPRVRRVLRTIAADEAEHATLLDRLITALQAESRGRS